MITAILISGILGLCIWLSMKLDLVMKQQESAKTPTLQPCDGAIRLLTNQGARIETGLVRFNNDWTGVFIRGDDAIELAFNLDTLLEAKKLNPESCVMAELRLLQLMKLLRDVKQRNQASC
jgi:hypothetical protein